MSAGAALRARAAGVVEAVLGHGRSLKAALAPALADTADARDRALLEAMCFTALRWRRRYEFALGTWLERPLPAREGPLRALLLIGLAQIDALGLSPHAAVSASAEAARMLGRPRQVGLVNALLRRALREGLPRSDDPAVAHSHPDWLVRALRRDWPQEWLAILEANNRPAPLWLRVNRRRIGRAAYRARLAEAGLAAAAPDAWPDALVLAEPVAPGRLPGWEEGWVSIQDGAAQRVADLLPLAPGARVLDACAAPGGKTAHLLERCPELRLTALDRDPQRLERVAGTLARLRLPAPERLQAADAGAPQTWWDGEPFDLILLDAPCSATGIIRRQPDIKWHRRRRDIEALAVVQARLLEALWPLLHPGGSLLYVTCSLLKDENERQIADFLTRVPDAAEEPLPESTGRSRPHGRQCLPGDGECDGFFYVRLHRRGGPRG